MITRQFVVFAAAGIGALATTAALRWQSCDPLHPGTRVLLDGHNAFPERGRWATRIDDVLATGTRWPSSTADVPAPFAVGPLLVLTGADPRQHTAFHDAVPVGDTLRLFGALPVPPGDGATPEVRAAVAVQRSAAAWIPARASNYVRWVNFPWSVVEEGGPRRAGPWTATDRARLNALVDRAHVQGLWVRFYALDGYTNTQDRGFVDDYNFGGLGAARTRWHAAIAAGVDFIASDQYAALGAELRRRR